MGGDIRIEEPAECLDCRYMLRQEYEQVLGRGKPMPPRLLCSLKPIKNIRGYPDFLRIPGSGVCDISTLQKWMYLFG